MTFEDLLARDGSLVYRTKGVSMEPMLRQDRDLVTIQVPETCLTSVQKEFPHLKAKLRWWDEFRKCTLLFYWKVLTNVCSYCIISMYGETSTYEYCFIY